MTISLPKRRDRWTRTTLSTLAVGGALLASMSLAQAQTAPLAGTSIGNRASATYTDGAGVARDTQSNLVTTTVQQVPAVDLTDPRTLLRNPGSPVYFPHTVTNTGNGSDRFNLTATNITGNLAGGAATVIYADANRDGVPDSTSPISQTTTLAPGETFSFVVGDVVPSTAAAGSTGTLTVNAISVANGGVADSNLDTVTAAVGAIVSLRKSIVGANQGTPGDGNTYTYSLRYTNSGSSTSGPVQVSDTLPARVAYVANSGSFNRAPGDALTDANDNFEQPGAGTAATSNSPNDINYQATGNTITFTVPSVPAGAEGLISFNFTVAAGATPGIASNTADLAYDNDNNGTLDSNDVSNTVDFRVLRNTAVTFTGQALNTPVAQGSTISFNNVLTNNGSGIDSFNVAISGSNNSFPAGTSFQLYTPDGQSPLLDTNGDQIPDTGPVGVGVSYTVVLKATLPPGATSPTAARLSVDKVATSISDTTVTATATDSAPAITAAAVDIDNNPTDNEDLTQAPVVTANGNPGGADAPIRMF